MLLACNGAEDSNSLSLLLGICDWFHYLVTLYWISPLLACNGTVRVVSCTLHCGLGCIITLPGGSRHAEQERVPFHLQIPRSDSGEDEIINDPV